MSMLQFSAVHTHYGPIHVLKGVNYRVEEWEIVCLLGANGAGKTTTMKTILGLVRPSSGGVSFKGKRIDRMTPRDVVKSGIAPVPEARRVFPRMNVMENLEMGA
ncbi:MAG: ATP-binding cassette domain-containing protein, partial [Chloroflexota bacterium]